MSYFQNEIWPTGPGTEIRVAGNLVSTANPFIIYQGEPPTAAISIGDNDISITRNVDIVGTFTINGSPISVTADVADLVPGTFGANEAPGAFSFSNGLNIVGTATRNLLLGEDVVNGIMRLESSPALSISNTERETWFTTGGLEVYSKDFDHYIAINPGSTLVPGGSINLIGTTHTLDIDSGAVAGFNASHSLVVSAGDDLEVNAFNDLLLSGTQITLAATDGVFIGTEKVPSLVFTSSTVVATPNTVNWDLGAVQSRTLNLNATINFSNPIAGRTYVLIIVQGTGGSRVPTLTGWDFGDNPPVWSTAVGAKDVVTGVYDGTQYLAAQAVANA